MIRVPVRVCALAVFLVLCLSSVLTAQARRSKPTAKPPAPGTAAARPAPAPAQQDEHSVPFKVGETLSYDVGWSTFLTAGNATITVQQKKPSYGSTAYYIAAEGRPTSLLSSLYTFYYKVDTLLDVYSLLPQRGSVYAEEGKRRRMKATLFNQAAKKAQYRSHDGDGREEGHGCSGLHAGCARGALRAAIDSHQGRRQVQYARLRQW